MSIVPQAVLDAAARLLDASHVEQVADLTTSGRSRVVRLRVAGGSSAGAVLKWGADSAAANACLLEFVQDVVPGLCPGLLGADLDLGFTIQEDLGPGDSLVDVLSGDDPVAAEAALVAHADALGRLAAATRGRFAEWEELVRRRGAPLTLLEPSPSAADILQCWDRVLARLPELGIGGNFGGAEAEFRRALDTIAAPGATSPLPLTPAELRLLPYLQTHLTADMIAKRLFISIHTVKTEIKAIYRKLGVSSRDDAVRKARETGLLGD